MAFEGPIEDRILIRELYGAYADATMRQDRDAYLACWDDDGARIAPDGEVYGKPAIAAHWDGIWSQVRRMGFFTEVGTIRVSGDTAEARVHCREIVRFRDGGTMRVVGRYDDALGKRDGGWLFVRRRYGLVLSEGDRAG